MLITELSKFCSGIDNMYRSVYTRDMMDTMSLSDFRAHLPEVVKRVHRGSRRVAVSVHGRQKVILVDAEELAALEETADVLAEKGVLSSINRALADVRAGRLIPFDRVVGESPKQILSGF